MGEIRPFQPRRRPAAEAEIRAALEAAIDQALDAVQVLIGHLDAIDGDPDREEGGDDEPSLGAPIGGDSQIPWAAGNDRDLEAALVRLGVHVLGQSPEPRP